MKQKQKTAEYSLLTRSSAIFSISVFVLVLAIGGVIFVLSMRQIVKTTKDNELVRLLENERIKLETPISDKIQIVLKMADSPLIQRYFASPDNKELEEMAVEEINGYRRALTGSSIFRVSDVDKRFYFDSNYVNTLDPTDTVNYWYHMTLHNTKTFNFNINYNPALDNLNLWINAPVFNSRREPIGVLGTGIDISVFIDALYEHLSGIAELYLFNSAGEITAARDVRHVAQKRKIADELGPVGPKIVAVAESLGPNETQIISTMAGEVAVTRIPTFGWYAVAIAPNSIRDYKTAMTWLFLAMLAAMALILVVLNIFIAKLSKPLQNTMKALEVASKAKSDFLARMSHEMRTPMNAIIGMTELSLREELPPAAREQTVTVKHAAVNLLSLINDILDLSKIESGKLEIVPVDYRLSSLVSDVIAIIKMKIVDSGLRLDVKVNGEIPDALFGDEIRIRQVLLNILSNAAKYTPKGSIMFGISGEITGEDTVILTINVADTGKGMKPEDVEKLFGDFVRVDVTANKDIEGTGLGLSITKNLVTAMGGSISVTSEYGKGSTFTVTLPQSVRSYEPMSLNMSDKFSGGAGESGVPTLSAPGAKILVVDDISTNLIVATGLMEPYKMRIDTCMSGEEAIKAVKANRYDVVFMDHMMPEMDGIEATRRIRELAGGYPHLKDLPIIALTANAVSGMKEMFLQSGFNDFLSKPIDVAKLDSALEKWIPKEKQTVAEIAASAGKKSGSGEFCVDGVDAALGMSRCGGTVDGYLQTLAVFCRDGRERSGALERALAAEDTPGYVTHVHALKSASANVGAAELSETAKALEAAGLSGNTAYIRARHARFMAKLEVLISDMEEAIAARKKKRFMTAADTEALSAALSKLTAALDNRDSEAINAVVWELGRFDGAADVGDEIENILRCIMYAEYDEAVSLIRSILKYY